MSVETLNRASGAVAADEPKVDAVLTERPAVAPRTVRADLSPEFCQLSDRICDLRSLASIAVLVHNDLMRQQVDGEQVDGYTVLHLTKAQVRQFNWIGGQIEHLAGEADKAYEVVEDMICQQGICVRLSDAL